MKRILRVLLLCVGMFVSVAAVADAIDTAKSQGLIGERADGYLGVVDESAASGVAALVRDINAKRQTEYDRIALKNGITRGEVEILAGKKTLAKTPPGGWIFATKWVKK